MLEILDENLEALVVCLLLLCVCTVMRFVSLRAGDPERLRSVAERLFLLCAFETTAKFKYKIAGSATQVNKWYVMYPVLMKC